MQHMHTWQSLISERIRILMFVLGAILLVRCGPSTVTPSVPTVNVVSLIPTDAGTAQVIYYWYLLDRDGAPVQLFECTNRLRFDDSGTAECVLSDDKRIYFSSAVPLMGLSERIPLKGEAP